MSESKKNVIFFTVFFLLLVSSVSFTYYRIFIKENFFIMSEVSCDKILERNCFLEEKKVCDDKNVCNVETRYFKKITKKAYNITKCIGENCPELICSEGEENCGYTYCTPEDEYEEGDYKVSCVE